MKPESERVSHNILVPVTLELRRRIERAAKSEETSLSEISRRAFRQYLDGRQMGQEDGGCSVTTGHH